MWAMWSDVCQTLVWHTSLKHLRHKRVAACAERPDRRHPRSMAPPRIEIVGQTYHVTAKAVHGTRLFVDDEDRLGTNPRRARGRLQAFVEEADPRKRRGQTYV